MVALLGPILAQLVRLSLADRSEAREVVGLGTYVEGSTRPLVGLNADGQHTHLTLSYSPLLTLTTLGTGPRQLLVLHSASVGASYVLRRTVLSVAGTMAYGDQNFQLLALAGGGLGVTQPTPATGVTAAGSNSPTPVPIGTVLGGTTTNGANGTATQTQFKAQNTVIRFESFSGGVAATHTTSANLSYGGEAGYTLSGAVASSDRADYPLSRGPRASAFARHGWGHSDSLMSTLAVQETISSTGYSAWLGVWNEVWTHRFDLHSSASLGAGLGGTRSPVQNDGSVVQYSVYPTASAGLLEGTIWEHGVLSTSLTIATAPYIDLTTSHIDPRVSLTGSAGWARDRFFSLLVFNSAFSLNGSNSQGALQSASGAASLGYVLGKAVSVDTGVRGTWQNFQGVEVLPFTYAVFVGINFGAQIPLR